MITMRRSTEGTMTQVREMAITKRRAPTQLSVLLETEMRKRNWSQKEFAARAGISTYTLNKALRRPRKPDANTLQRLAAALEIDVHLLIDAANAASLTPAEIAQFDAVSPADVDQLLAYLREQVEADESGKLFNRLTRYARQFMRDDP